MLVAAEAARDPVQDDPDARLVAGVDEVLELLGLAIAGGGGKVARDLVAPRAVEGVLHHGQDLYVRVAHAPDVAHQLVRELVVSQVAAGVVIAVWVTVAGQAVIVTPPAAQMHLEDVERGLHHVALGTLGQVARVFPRVAREVGRARGRPRGALRVERVGVGLVQEVAIPGLHHVLVQVTRAHARDEARPDATVLGAGKVIFLDVPVVEVADDTHAPDVRRPHGKLVACDAIRRGRVRAQLLVAAIPLALRKQEEVVAGKGQIRRGTDVHEPSPKVALSSVKTEGTQKLQQPVPPFYFICAQWGRLSFLNVP